MTIYGYKPITIYKFSLDSLKIYHLKIEYDSERDLLIYKRKLEEGSGPAIYGLEVCKSLDLGDDFISFLYWLKDKCDYKANEIIHVVEKPWRYRKEYHHFLEKGDEEE